MPCKRKPSKRPKHLYRRGPAGHQAGTWYLRVVIKGKAYREPLSRHFAEAKRLRDIRINELRTRPWHRAPATFADAAKLWLEGKGATTRKAAALENAQNYVDRHLNPVIGAVPLEKLTRAHLWALRRGLETDSLWTVASIMSTARAILGNVDQWQRLHERGMVPVPKRQPADRLTDSELRAVLEVAARTRSRKCADSWEPYVRLSVLTGIRWGELRALRWDSFNRKPDPYLLLRETKDGGFRKVPLGSPALEVVERLWALNQTEPSVYVLRHRVDNPPTFSVPGVDRPGGKGWHWHMLRHTFASRWVEAGGSLSALQKIMGHKDIRTTLIYADPSEKSVFLEAERVTIDVNAASVTGAESRDEVAG